uniref:Uncharacterized protein n=1 Tax=Arundo donax TaxID=35708 RepID=A0A0A9A8K3_ARUDO
MTIMIFMRKRAHDYFSSLCWPTVYKVLRTSFISWHQFSIVL